MTKVEQIDWSKFKQYEPVKKPYKVASSGTRNYKKIIETKKGPIKSYKMVDRHLIAEDIANRNHLRSIKYET